MNDQPGIAFLTERIDEIERDRDALSERAQRLEFLQRSFVDIIAAVDERAVALAAMRGAWLGLGFNRAIWFSILETNEINALYEIDEGVTADSEYGGTLPAASSLVRVTTGDSDIATGFMDDPDVPLFDTRRRYAAASVRPSVGGAFVLYVDGSNERTRSTWSVSSLRELANHATFGLERMRMAAELERLAMHDPLTGLINRRAMLARLESELATFKRTGDSLAFAMIDVDNFKTINDTRGHAGGDAALQAIANVLQTRTRETDVPARFAGDEFALIMPRTDAATITTVMERVYDGLGEHGLGASIGVAFAHRDISAEALIAKADDGVYAAKRAGKNTYRVATFE